MMSEWVQTKKKNSFDLQIDSFMLLYFFELSRWISYGDYSGMEESNSHWICQLFLIVSS